MARIGRLPPSQRRVAVAMVFKKVSLSLCQIRAVHNAPKPLDAESRLKKLNQSLGWIVVAGGKPFLEKRLHVMRRKLGRVD